MTTQIYDLGVELSDHDRQQILGKLGKLDKFLTHVPEEDVLLRVRLSPNQQNPRWTDALVDLDVFQQLEGVLVGSGSASSPVHAVHLAVIHVERQLEERKERIKPYP